MFSIKSKLALSISLLTVSVAALAAGEISQNQTANKFTQENFFANKASYNPTFQTNEKFVNGWGVAIRPAGAGGHFWVIGKDISYEFVGDVRNSTDSTLQKLHVDELKEVKFPIGNTDAFGTGVVFVDSQKDFTITQKVKTKDGVEEEITAPAKFIFASDGGVISAWTERKNADGTKDFPLDAISVIDESASGASFFGIATSADYSKLYAADFGSNPTIKTYGGDFKPLDIKFDTPFDINENGKFDAGEYAPFNIQSLKTPAGENHLFVAYAKTQICPEAEVSAGNCKAGELFVGEEDTSVAGLGRVAEFTEDGKLVSVWNDGGKLSAPWGFAYAPSNFGALSNALLVTNFGDGTISAYDAKTKNFIDYVRNEAGKPVEIEGIWGVTFGNGESLGDKDALYFAAGPEDEVDGLFGVLRLAK